MKIVRFDTFWATGHMSSLVNRESTDIHPIKSNLILTIIK